MRDKLEKYNNNYFGKYGVKLNVLNKNLINNQNYVLGKTLKKRTIRYLGFNNNNIINNNNLYGEINTYELSNFIDNKSRDYLIGILILAYLFITIKFYIGIFVILMYLIIFKNIIHLKILTGKYFIIKHKYLIWNIKSKYIGISMIILFYFLLFIKFYIGILFMLIYYIIYNYKLYIKYITREYLIIKNKDLILYFKYTKK